jgi:hypothetical protein
MSGRAMPVTSAAGRTRGPRPARPVEKETDHETCAQYLQRR